MFPEATPSAEVLSAFERIMDIVWDLGHESAGTEHILLALVQGCPDLFRQRCDPEELESAVLELAPAADAPDPARRGEVPLTPGAVAALKAAAAEVEREAASELRAHHLVLGLLQEEDSIAAAALRHVGIRSRADW